MAVAFYSLNKNKTTVVQFPRLPIFQHSDVIVRADGRVVDVIDVLNGNSVLVVSDRVTSKTIMISPTHKAIQSVYTWEAWQSNLELVKKLQVKKL